MSTTHVAVHKFLSHDIICGKCGEACEGNCLELIASEIEKAGEEEMEIAQKKLKNRIGKMSKCLVTLLMRLKYASKLCCRFIAIS